MDQENYKSFDMTALLVGAAIAVTALVMEFVF